ncbi:PGF-CTERM sorting domain-containing protein [Natrarchaeobaculum sulfurireducens]|uniref:PGF-CTERM archaeal protein-sorting signal domain-containing protein n=1 Tax=Natrarchaeobaculum sulfurireducens TaxID=2044521 RepID=A0A346PQB7_9EURY|nr:PGF-CTERM sorting domain-containing protein [Natrarchaeobaculum sulfurireducens]AXR81712.1 hypothetical protein AArcMg_1702 [Natrarchaeobaculum sulfurireducens]
MTHVDNTQIVESDWEQLAVRLTVGAAAGILLVGLMAVMMAGVGAATEEQFADNVTLETEDDSLELEVSFNDSIDDEDATADVHFYDADEYTEGGNENNALEEDSIDANAGQTLATTFDWSDYDDLEHGEDYTVVVDGDDDAIESVARLDDGLIGGGVGGADSVPGFGVVVAIAALATAGILAARSN